MKELREVNPGAYQVWATGQVSTCDYAGMIFTYGYYGVAALVPLGFLVLVIYSRKEKRDRNKNQSVFD